MSGKPYFGDLVSPQGAVDYDLLVQIKRDICYLYHELANYSYIMGDLAWGSLYRLPYWRYLEIVYIDRDRLGRDYETVAADREFIRDGCLVMILAMAEEYIMDAGSYIKDHIDACKEAVARTPPDDEDSYRLIRAVELALALAGRDRLEGPEAQEQTKLSLWVHKRYVQGYFTQMARQFETSPYYQWPKKRWWQFWKYPRQA